MSPTVRNALLAAAILVATACAYWPVTEAGFVWDDDDYVTGNALLWEEDGLRRIWLSSDAPSQYFPLVYTSFRLEHALWGLDPLGYHVVNVVLHGINALLVWWLLALLGVPGAWLGGAIFALHPVHVESVAWVTERKNTLSMLFFALASISWLRFSEPPPTGGGARHYLGALGSFALALTAKTTAVVFPAAQILGPWMLGRPIGWRRVREVLPFAALGLAMGLVTLLFERTHQGTVGERFALGFAEAVLVSGRAVFFYLGKLLWPVDLAFSYPRFEVDPGDPLQWLWPLALVVGLGALWRLRPRIGRGPVAAALFYVAALSPLLGFIPLYTFLYTFVADHYQYIPSVAPIGALAAACAWAGRRRALRGAAVPAALVLLIVLGTLTFQQSRSYRDRETLWRHTLAVNPDSWMAHHNLGRVLLAEGRAEEAIEAFEGALEVSPGLPQPHRNIGIALLRLGRTEEAIDRLRLSVAVDPGFVNGHLSLAAALVRNGDIEGARLAYQEVLRVRPGHAGAHRALGALASPTLSP